MREQIAEAMKSALRTQDKLRLSTLRLIQAAIKDRDIAQRGAGKDPVTPAEIAEILARMIRQRQESARQYEEGGRPELAERERAEIAIIEQFLPRQLAEDEIRQVCAEAVQEAGASGLRDMGKCMAVLKERYAGRMDFSRASGIVREMLS
jgi:uncharacterized protein YqeY